MPTNPPHRMPSPVSNEFSATGMGANAASIGPGKFSVALRTENTATTATIRLLCSLDEGTTWHIATIDASGTLADYALSFSVANQTGLYLVGEALEPMLLKPYCSAIAGGGKAFCRIAQGPFD